ncbi:MAG: ATP-dependent 6-phosphofructokinase [bacterium]
MTRRIGILTGGGDCPGLNAVIRAAVKTARGYGWEVLGIRDGFDGLRKVDTFRLSRERIKGILPQGGTILGSTNKCDPFCVRVGDQIEDQSDQVVENFKLEGLDALITIGGDGTQAIAWKFYQLGIPVVAVPKTIDNDLWATDITFGFDTAVETATLAIDKLHPTAESHERVMVVEVMGRGAGWIALHAGIAGGADVILIPEISFDLDLVCQAVQRRYDIGRDFAIVVVAEGARIRDDQLGPPGSGNPITGSRRTDRIGQYIQDQTGHDVRAMVLGHLQRGGSPTTFDRVLGSRLGAAAVRLVRDGQYGKMVAVRGSTLVPVDMADVAGKVRTVDPEDDLVHTARDLGISFGDRPV